jgi:hypothetical protein
MTLVKSLVGKWLGSAQPVPALRRNSPEPGDIVKVAIPADENPNRPGAQFRYALVLNAQNVGGKPTVQIAPGAGITSTLAKNIENEHIFHMANPKAAAAAGLPGPMSFDLSKAKIIEWNAAYTPPNEKPLVGAIPEADYTRFMPVYRGWREAQKVAANAARVAAERPTYVQPVSYSDGVRDVLRNKGRETEVWTKASSSAPKSVQVIA